MAIEVDVRHNDVEQAIRRLKKLMNREGLFREMRDRRYHVKPFEKNALDKKEGVRRARKNERMRKRSL